MPQVIGTIYGVFNIRVMGLYGEINKLDNMTTSDNPSMTHLFIVGLDEVIGCIGYELY